jgi:hypothetical protein
MAPFVDTKAENLQRLWLLKLSVIVSVEMSSRCHLGHRGEKRPYQLMRAGCTTDDAVRLVEARRSEVPRPRVWVRDGFVHRVKCQSGYPWAQSSWKLTPDRRAATCGAVQREGSAQRFDTVPEPGET